jgi:hypothetical protein
LSTRITADGQEPLLVLDLYVKEGTLCLVDLIAHNKSGTLLLALLTRRIANSLGTHQNGNPSAAITATKVDGRLLLWAAVGAIV